MGFNSTFKGLMAKKIAFIPIAQYPHLYVERITDFIFPVCSTEWECYRAEIIQR